VQSLFTRRLELRPGTARVLRAELRGRADLERALAVPVPAEWPPEFYDAGAIQYVLAQMGERDDAGPFGFYYLILLPGQLAHAPGGAVVGAGGFKGPPNDAGEVEVGYSVLSSFQRMGLATEAVKGWSMLAFQEPRVTAVIAQTLPSLAPSIRVLEKAGFNFAGAGDDPDAPPHEQVVRYALPRPARDERTGHASP
jgi:RimJ/RimL family protein N-acetyltransferase